jgi:hypothetical protein
VPVPCDDAGALSTWTTQYRVPNACPRDVPEPPSAANDHHQQQSANMKLARALNPRATHGNTLVMRCLSVPDRVGGHKVIIGHRCTIA